MRIAVLGGGAFGTALALALSRDGTGVTLWSRDATDADEMRRTRKSGKHLPGLDLPDSLTVSYRDGRGHPIRGRVASTSRVVTP